MTLNITIFQYIGESIEGASNAFVLPASASLIETLHTTCIAGVGLYIALMGYLIISGTVEESFYTLLKQCTKIIVIASFALNVDSYSGWVIDGFKNLESGLINALSQKKDILEPVSFYKTLDLSVADGLGLAFECMKKADSAGWSSFGTALGWLLAMLLIAIGTIIIAALGGVVVMVAKFSLAVMFAIGPLFIMCLMWPVTAKFFDAWFSQVMNYIFTVVIMAMIMSFSIEAFNAFIHGFDVSSQANPLLVSFQVIGLVIVLSWIILHAGSMASGLAGGVSMAMMSLQHMRRSANVGSYVAKGTYMTAKVGGKGAYYAGKGTAKGAQWAGSTLKNYAYKGGLLKR